MDVEGHELKYNIDVKRKGVFVTVEETIHKLCFHPTNAEPFDWGKEAALNYARDTVCLEKLFGLENPVNQLKKNLGNGDGEFESFDQFIDEICDHKKYSEPEFLMFFLMSHGFEDGKFLLSCEGIGKDEHGNDLSARPCCLDRENKQHSFHGNCFGRDVGDVIKKVCDSKRFSKCPKMFFLQLCRGGNEKNLEWSSKNSVDQEQLSHPISTNSDIELFLPGYPDTLVFRASTEGYVSNVQSDTAFPGVPSGSLLIQSFCSAVKELQKSNWEFSELIKKVQKSEAPDLNHLVTALERRREDISGGWIMNVCQRTSAWVTNYLVVDIAASTPSLKPLLTTDEETFCDQTSESQEDETHTSFVGQLEGYKRELNHKIKVNRLFKMFAGRGNQVIIQVLHFLWFKTRTRIDKVEFDAPVHSDEINEEEKACLRTELNEMVRWIKEGIPCSEKLYNFLCGLEYERLPNTAEEEDSPQAGQLIKEFMQRLEGYSSDTQDLHLVEEVISLCKENGKVFSQHVLCWLWIYLPRVNRLPNHHLCIADWQEDQNAVLETKLNTMIKNIQVQSAYGKQQPHVSSCLSKQLSMIEILESQGRATPF